jgi:type I restriction enzyme, S subunit
MTITDDTSSESRIKRITKTIGITDSADYTDDTDLKSKQSVKSNNPCQSVIPTGYKQTEVGVIPEDWEVQRLKELIAIKSGFAFSSTHFSDKGPILLTPGNFKLTGGLYFNERNTKRYAGPYSTSMVFDYGDLLIVMTDLTPDCNLLGKPAFVQLHEPILHNQRIGKIIPVNRKFSFDFLYWFFLSDTYAVRMKETATGSTVRHTSNGSIYGSLIALPPTKAEQEAIAKALSDTDALIESLEQLITKKRRIKQGAMQELLTGKKRLPGFSGESEVKRLGDVLKVCHGKSQHNVVVVGGKYPILASGGEIGRTNEYLYDKPSVLIGRKGTIDVPQFIDTPFWTIDTLFFTEIDPAADAKFIFYKFNTINWRSYNEASGVPSLSASRIENIGFSCPPLPEQTAIATILSDMDTEITALETKLAKTRNIKQGMMHNLLTGRIRLV